MCGFLHAIEKAGRGKRNGDAVDFPDDDVLRGLFVIDATGGGINGDLVVDAETVCWETSPGWSSRTA